MAVNLSWSNPNTLVTEDEVRVYRSTSPMVVGALPAALAVLPAGTTFYSDTSAVDGTTYFYRVSAVKGAVEEVSGEIEVLAPATGGAVIAPVSCSWVSGGRGFMMTEDNKNIFSANGDRLYGSWFGTRVLLLAMVIVDEKRDVLGTEKVVFSTDDATSVPTEFLSGAVDGDEITWEGILQLLLVQTKSDAGNAAERVLGAELIAKYQIGGTAAQAISYWCGVAAIRAGAATVSVSTMKNTVSGQAIDDPIVATMRDMTKIMRAAMAYPELLAIMQMESVAVPVTGAAPKTLSFNSADFCQQRRFLNASTSGGTTVQGGEVPGYLVGMVGDSTATGHQLWGFQYPNGRKVFGAVRDSTDSVMRAVDVVGMAMAAQTYEPTLRSAEVAADPHAAAVALHLKGEVPAVDHSPLARVVTNTGVSEIASDYMHGRAQAFDSGDFLSLAGAVDLGAGDFTLEVFLRGIGATGSGAMTLIGQWQNSSDMRGWRLYYSGFGFYFSWGTSAFGAAQFLAQPMNRTAIFKGGPVHVAVQRSGADLAIFVNGFRSATYNIGTFAFLDRWANGVPVTVGAELSSSDTASQPLVNVALEEVVLTKGVVRYPMTGFFPIYRAARWD